MTGDAIHSYIPLKCSDAWANEIDLADPAATKARIAAKFTSWPPVLTSLITESDTLPVHRPIYALPDDHRWNRALV